MWNLTNKVGCTNSIKVSLNRWIYVTLATDYHCSHILSINLYSIACLLIDILAAQRALNTIMEIVFQHIKMLKQWYKWYKRSTDMTNTWTYTWRCLIVLHFGCIAKNRDGKSNRIFPIKVIQWVHFFRLVSITWFSFEASLLRWKSKCLLNTERIAFLYVHAFITLDIFSEITHKRASISTINRMTKAIKSGQWKISIYTMYNIFVNVRTTIHAAVQCILNLRILNKTKWKQIYGYRDVRRKSVLRVAWSV